MPSTSRQAALKRTAAPIRLEQDIPNKHQARTDETRRKLMKSAYKIFAQDGFEAARLEDIAKDAGHTRGAFYAHFSSKEDVFFALLEKQIYRHLEKVQGLVDAESTLQSKLRALREYYVTKLHDPNWSMLMLEFKMFAVRRPKIRAKLAAAYRAMRTSTQLKGITELLAAQDSAANICPEGRRIILDTLLQCLILQRAFDPVSLSADDAGKALRTVFDLVVMSKSK